MAADSRAASSGRQRTIRSTSAMMSRLAEGSRRRSNGRLFRVTWGIAPRRSRMPRPVVPDSPSMKTVVMRCKLLPRRGNSRGGGGKARGVRAGLARQMGDTDGQHGQADKLDIAEADNYQARLPRFRLRQSGPFLSV